VTLGWIYVALFGATLAVNLVCLLIWNRELIGHRVGMSPDGKIWDKVWMLFFTPATIAVFVVPAYDPGVDPWSALGPAWALGFAVFAFSWALICWSMVVNPFFEKVVRIQTERGHRVVATGPYAVVRHPGYVGFAGWLVSTPLLLGSTWAFVPAALTVVILVVRTVLEDRMLREELAGYADYAERVRYRLVPGLW
jgi:protein-S-isoprenylcysteine O-methyltransferase Ste14